MKILLLNTKFRKQLFKITILGVVLILAFLAIRTLITNASTSGKPEISRPLSSDKINRDFNFSIKDRTGREVTKIKYVIESVDLTKEVAIQGKKATAVNNKSFLIFNVKLINEFNKPVELTSKDYVRLIVNNKDSEQLAPDVHNDPVEVQAGSAKNTWFGFTISENDKDLKIKVGEIVGPKEEIEIKI